MASHANSQTLALWSSSIKTLIATLCGLTIDDSPQTSTGVYWVAANTSNRYAVITTSTDRHRRAVRWEASTRQCTEVAGVPRWPSRLRPSVPTPPGQRGQRRPRGALRRSPAPPETSDRRISDPRHFGPEALRTHATETVHKNRETRTIGSEMSGEHFGPGSEVSEHFGPKRTRQFGPTYMYTSDLGYFEPNTLRTHATETMHRNRETHRKIGSEMSGHFWLGSETSSGHFGPGTEVSGHFGPKRTRHFGPKCMQYDVQSTVIALGNISSDLCRNNGSTGL